MKPFFGKTIGVLVVCTILCGATYGAEENVSNAYIEKLMSQTILDLTVSDVDLAQIISLLKKQTGVNFVIVNGENKKATFSLHSPTLKEVLFAALYPIGLGYRIRPNGDVIIDEESSLLEKYGPGLKPQVENSQNKEKTLSILNRRLEDVTVNEIELNQLLSLLQAQTGVPMVVGAGINRKVTFSLSQPTLGEVLDTVLPLSKLGYRVTSMGLYIDKENILQEKFGDKSVTKGSKSDYIEVGFPVERYPVETYAKALRFLLQDLNLALNSDPDKQMIVANVHKDYLDRIPKAIEEIENEELFYVARQEFDDVLSNHPRFLKWLIGLFPEETRMELIVSKDNQIQISGYGLDEELLNKVIETLNDFGEKGYKEELLESETKTKSLYFNVFKSNFKSKEPSSNYLSVEDSGFFVIMRVMESQYPQALPISKLGKGYKIIFMSREKVALKGYDGKEHFLGVGDVVNERVNGDFKIKEIRMEKNNPRIVVQDTDTEEEATIAAR